MPSFALGSSTNDVSRIIGMRHRRRVIRILAKLRNGYYTTPYGLSHIHRDMRFLTDYDKGESR